MGVGVCGRGDLGVGGWDVDMDKDENRGDIGWGDGVVGGVVGVVYYGWFFCVADRVLGIFPLLRANYFILLKREHIICFYLFYHLLF